MILLSKYYFNSREIHFLIHQQSNNDYKYIKNFLNYDHISYLIHSLSLLYKYLLSSRFLISHGRR